MAPTQRSSGGPSPNDRKRSRTDDVNNNDQSNALAAAAAAARRTKERKNRGATKNANAGTMDSSSSNSPSQQMTTYGLGILVIAIVVGMVWNQHEETLTDPTIRALWSVACTSSSSSSSSSHKALCGRMVQPTRRTMKASRPIRPGERLVEIPRSLQLWELDALRDPFIQNEGLLEARHELTKNPLPGGAFLAVYLALEQKKRSDTTGYPGGNTKHDDNNKTSTRSIEVNKLHSAYLKSLPTWDDLTDHPLLWSREELKDLLGVNSWCYAVVLMYREMIASEYAALSTTSDAFASHISKSDYDVARIHVLTRSFNPGPEGCLADEEELSLDERNTLASKLGIQEDGTGKAELFAEGCHAMVPFLDMLNHHPKPNVLYKYDTEKRAFVITAKTNIPVQWELIDSYGKFSDSHLFAKFGFVNGDGSGYTQASIALFHRPLDIQMKNEFTMLPLEVQKQLAGPTTSTTKFLVPEFQQHELKRYLQFDDGYHDCIEADLHPKAFALKELKWKHLAKIANKPDNWIVALHPRSPESLPVQSSDMLITDEPPEIDPRKVRMDITHLVETCRLLALTVDDYDGMAAKVLRNNLANNSFVVERGDEALEYRALMYLARLASTALRQYPTTPRQQYELVAELNSDDFGSRNWTAAHLRLGEMQSLHAIAGVARMRALEWEENAITEPDNAAYYVREQSCPKQYTDIMKEIE